MYIVISIPNLKSTACGVSHFISMLLDSGFCMAAESGRHIAFAIFASAVARGNAIIMKLVS